MTVPERRVGTDTVRFEAGRLVLFCRADMPEWEVRKFRRTLIRFDGQAFHLTIRSPQPDGSVRYVLEPWPEDFPDPPLREIEYNEDLVRLRDEALAEVRMSRVRLGLFSPVLPLIGFLPSAVKARIQDSWGINAQTATAFSLWLEYLVMLVLSALLAINAFTGIFRFTPSIVALFVLLADVIVRKNSLLAEETEPPGFYEWLFRMKLW